MTPNAAQRVPQRRTFSRCSGYRPTATDALAPPSPAAVASGGPREGRREPIHLRDTALGRGSSKQDDVLRVDPDALARVGVLEPRELHDRTSGGGQDRALDVLSGALDSAAVPTEHRDLGRHRRPA